MSTGMSECLGIVQRNHLDIKLFSAGLLDQFEAIGDHRERGEAQEVHFEEAEFFDGLHVIGGDYFIILAATDGNEVGERTRCDDDG